MKPIAEIFSQGEELVNGQIVDSNAAWLSLQLSQIGFQVKRHTAVGDHLHDLVELFREIDGHIAAENDVVAAECGKVLLQVELAE